MTDSDVIQLEMTSFCMKLIEKSVFQWWLHYVELPSDVHMITSPGTRTEKPRPVHSGSWCGKYNVARSNPSLTNDNTCHHGLPEVLEGRVDTLIPDTFYMFSWLGQIHRISLLYKCEGTVFLDWPSRLWRKSGQQVSEYGYKRTQGNLCESLDSSYKLLATAYVMK